MVWRLISDRFRYPYKFCFYCSATNISVEWVDYNHAVKVLHVTKIKDLIQKFMA